MCQIVEQYAGLAFYWVLKSSEYAKKTKERLNNRCKRFGNSTKAV